MFGKLGRALGAGTSRCPCINLVPKFKFLKTLESELLPYSPTSM